MRLSPLFVRLSPLFVMSRYIPCVAFKLLISQSEGNPHGTL